MRRRHLLLATASLAALTPPARADERAVTGYTENLPPLNYQGKDGVQGFAAELLQLICLQAGLPLELSLLPWPRAVQQADANPRGLLFSLTRTPERESQYQWMGPIGARRIVVYKLAQRTDLQLARLSDLGDHKLGVVRDSATSRQLLAQGLKPGQQLELGLDDASNLRKLLAGRMDYVLLLDWAAAWQLKQLQLPYSTLQPVLDYDSDKSYWYGLRPDADAALVKRLQAALDTLRRDGRYERLRQRYFS